MRAQFALQAALEVQSLDEVGCGEGVAFEDLEAHVAALGQALGRELDAQFVDLGLGHADRRAAGLEPEVHAPAPQLADDLTAVGGVEARVEGDEAAAR